MSSGSKKIFPILLDILSHKPDLAETDKTLLKDLKAKLKKEDITMKNLKGEYQAALEEGQNLGIIHIKNEDIILPIRSRKRKTGSTTSPSRQSSPSNLEDKPSSSRRRRSRSSRRGRSTRSRSKGVRRRASRGRRSRRPRSA